MTNRQRAERAAAALDAYIKFTGDRPDECHFRDLLGDLMHLADRDGAGEKHGEGRNLTFDEALALARGMHETEKAEDE